MQQPYSIAKAWMVVTVLVAWFATGLQLYILVDNTPGNGMTPSGALDRFLIFFTIWTNLVIAFCLTSILLSQRSRLGRFFSTPFTQTAIALYILIVFLIYNVVLRGLVHPQGRDRLADELLHVVVPVLFLSYWLCFVPKGTLKWRHLFPWMIYPAVYLVYALVRGAYSDFYPYPFLAVNRLGYQKVALNSVGVMVVFIVAGLLFIGLDRFMRPKLAR